VNVVVLVTEILKVPLKPEGDIPAMVIESPDENPCADDVTIVTIVEVDVVAVVIEAIGIVWIELFALPPRARITPSWLVPAFSVEGLLSTYPLTINCAEEIADRVAWLSVIVVPVMFVMTVPGAIPVPLIPRPTTTEDGTVLKVTVVAPDEPDAITGIELFDPPGYKEVSV